MPRQKSASSQSQSERARAAKRLTAQRIATDQKMGASPHVILRRRSAPKELKMADLSRGVKICCHPERREGPGGAGGRGSIFEPPAAQVPRYARDDRSGCGCAALWRSTRVSLVERRSAVGKLPQWCVRSKTGAVLLLELLKARHHIA